MDIFSVFTLCGGLAFFLYGMTTMSKSLEKMAGGRLEQMLKRMTASPLKSLLLGAGITIAIQSSSAMTVMLVGLVNSGVMELGQTIGVIMGSNIGTTLTAWILAMTGIESENVFVNLLKPENFSPLLALAGIILIMGSKKQRRRDMGRIMVGFSILMYGMELMKQAVSPLADMPEFSSLLTAFNNPLLGVLVGAVFTGVIQSSAASVGILQALALTGSITYGIAIPVIMGQNIGTCVTALISSIGVNRNARRVAVIHISFNIIGSAVCLLLFYGGDILFHFQFLNYTVGALGIAACHTIFNVFTTLMLLPFSRQLEKLARAVIRGENKAEEFAFLDPLLLHTPSVAISECVAMSNRMGEVARENVHLALCQLSDYSNARESEILANEDKLDIYEDRLGSYLVQISQHGVSMNDIRTVSRLLHAIGDFERIGDHALNLQESAQELHEKELHFSEPANEELQVLLAAMDEIMEKAFGSFQQDSAAMAVEVEPLEETIDRLIEEIRMQHIRRLQTGACTIQLGFVFNDLLTNLERVSDHCSNIAVSIIEEQGDQVDRHTYINELKEESAFNMRLKDNLQKYQLPKG
ncbi:Na/Pi cotransporter family protein [Dysosmobacter sp. NSJ-60]|uniref:Na/Pi cotransporter n=1 Tax=Pusillibacter faecalis TaxID=2714358 RepID=A0A810QES1_9FIRM|nr:Na/Pi cotransporter family protein [Pusillibacter faecalis]MBC5747245.1 Na/Pi cotransporter family protein [Dysosmobacter hominis]MBS5658860.1 Na/Pi cotransporter family protein [Oscillibacter sp.]MCQ5027651.1 Na/Pi cotransporter family protein [Oscillibacter valericigenes]BCK84642.1 Na/Pi cotransporter [Pusillibacter faecalis]